MDAWCHRIISMHMDILPVVYLDNCVYRMACYLVAHVCFYVMFVPSLIIALGYLLDLEIFYCIFLSRFYISLIRVVTLMMLLFLVMILKNKVSRQAL